MRELRVRLATGEDDAAIIELFTANSYQRLTAAQRAQGGFVQGALSPEVLAAMRRDIGVIIAEIDSALVGFVCTCSPGAGVGPPPVQEIVRRAAELSFAGRPLADLSWFIYGPVAVDAAVRRQGVQRRLFNAVKDLLADRFDAGVAFVDDSNAVSRAVHLGSLAMTPIGGFTLCNQSYTVLAFPL